MRLAALLMILYLGACSKREPMQLWYWHHSYLVTAEALAKSEALVDRASAAGYTGVALWDSSLVFLDETTYLEQFISYARAKGLTVMPAVLPYGHSDDILKRNLNWAEGQRVIGAKFRRDGEDLRYIPGPIVELGDNKYLVEPWHQYHVKFERGARGSVGVVDSADSRLTRLSDDAGPGGTEFTFNSAESISVHVFGPSQFSIEPVALEHVIRREGAPMKVTSVGQEVSMDYYAVTPVSGAGTGVCLTDPDVQRWAAHNVAKVAEFLPPGSPLFLQHDEMRHMNSCASCRRMNMTAGQLLAWSLRGLINSLPQRPLYIWSDMFDPWHNAVSHYYYVEGDLHGSWEGLPGSATVMNWNEKRRRASLAWFSGRGNRQVIAGYYDPQDHNGGHAARKELFEANGIRGVDGVMYTTWKDDYSQLESYAQGARAQWPEYLAARPW